MNVVFNERDVRNLIWEMANSDNVRIRHHERNYRINSRVTLTCNDICFGKLFTMQIMIDHWILGIKYAIGSVYVRILLMI